MNTDDRSISRLDLALARFLGARSQLNKAEQSQFEQLICQLSSEQRQGHSCILVAASDRDLLRRSGLVSEQDATPLILEQDRLYLHRYWHYETRLARQLLQLTRSESLQQIHDQLLDRYFPAATETVDWQKEAAKTAINKTLSIVTGGPGTGKTTTVVKILAILLELAPAEQIPLIALAAPTGKAAMRLQESIGNNKSRLPCSDIIKDQIPETVTTLHRLLKVRPNSPYFYHDADTPLPHDLIVVDEASMIDLALMSKLVDALKPKARLILLGDKDQLASVESGAVLADLTSALPDNTLELKKSHRFDADIKALAEAVNLQQPQTAWQHLLAGNNAVTILQDELTGFASERMEDYLKQIRAGADYRQIHLAFNAFQILCATRHGTNSVNEINRQIQKKLAVSGLIDPSSGIWYSGRPIMITQNDPDMQLFNGDIGICLADRENHNKLRVFFLQANGSIKKYLPSRLPHCETVFAMTIHKSQGSEFDEVLIALPDILNPILTKELIYTAITRAKKHVYLATEKQIFIDTIQQRVNRQSGLRYKLLPLQVEKF